jgi:hypothetical protein
MLRQQAIPRAEIWIHPSLVGDFEAATASGFVKAQLTSICRPQQVQLQSDGSSRILQTSISG